MAVKGTCQITLIDMTDAYSVMLTSETHTFQGNSVGAPAGSTCSTEIVAYCGNDLCKKVSVTAANIKCPTGISATVSNNNTVSPMVTFKTTAIITGSCEATIPVVLDDVTVNKKFSFAVAKKGATGKPGIDFSQGKLLYTDPSFIRSSNKLTSYNNSSKGTVNVTREKKSSDNPMSDTDYEIVIKSTGTPYPGIGGVYGMIQSRANAVFIRRVIAKIPVGRSLHEAQNAMGNGYVVEWLTSNAGTGKFTEYIYKYTCGADGTFSTGGHMYVDGAYGTTDSPVVWYIAYCATFDMTSTSDIQNTIKNVDVEYYLSTSSTSLAGGSWSTTAPAWVNGKYMWSRTVTTDGVGNKTYSPSQNGVCIAGAKGDKGDKGDTGGTGATGKGVSSIVEQYYKSTSATSLSGGSWSTTYPGWENGKYIWTRSVFTYSDKTTTTTTPICATGAKGDTGDTGLPALQPKRNWGSTYTTVGGTVDCTTSDFNRTPVVGDTFTNLDASSNTGTWQVTAISGTKVTIKLLSYVKSKGETGAAGKDGKMLYSTSSTAAATAAKVATISPATSFSLYTGATVSVYFPYANTAASPTLNINSTGAKPIYVYGAVITSVYYWPAKSTVQFTYDGSHWVMNDNSAMSTIASWCYKNDKTIINGGKLAAGSVATNALAAKAVTAAKIDVDDLFAQSITAKKMTITGDSVFEGKLNGATGVFSGNVKADSIIIGNDTGDSFDYGMQINTKGIKMRAGTNNYVDITGGLQVNTRTMTGLLSALEETVAVKGTLTVNGKDIDDMYEPIVKRANAGVYYKEGYQCYLHAWWVNATDVFFTVSESYKPKKMTTCIGFCMRKDDARAFPLMCELEASGAWQVWALTGIGVSGGQGMWVVYQPANGIDHRSEFTVCITGSWLTNTNGGR